MTGQTKVYTVHNILEVRNKIEELERQGLKGKIYVLAHDNERTTKIVEQTDSHKIGVSEEGILAAAIHLFRSTGEELRAKLRTMGVSKEHAEHLEALMDVGKIVILT